MPDGKDTSVPVTGDHGRSVAARAADATPKVVVYRPGEGQPNIAIPAEDFGRLLGQAGGDESKLRQLVMEYKQLHLAGWEEETAEYYDDTAAQQAKETAADASTGEAHQESGRS